MGLAASHSRYLMLFARKSDIEYRGQRINQKRLALATKSERLARLFSDNIANRDIKIRHQGQDIALTVPNLAQVNLEAYYVDSNGNVANDISSDLLEEGLRNNTISLRYIEMPQSPEPPTGTVDWRASAIFNDRLYTEDDQFASADYEADSASLHTEDKKLEIELKNIEVQHSAVQTEIDAVKKVIDKNIEKSFKTFG